MHFGKQVFDSRRNLQSKLSISCSRRGITRGCLSLDRDALFGGSGTFLHSVAYSVAARVAVVGALPYCPASTLFILLRCSSSTHLQRAGSRTSSCSSPGCSSVGGGALSKLSPFQMS
ncbi:unnamed protein product [Calypogeia fissa]